MDNIQAPPKWMMIMEPRGILEVGSVIKSMPILENLPKGSKEPVLVIPGLTTEEEVMIIS